VDSKKSPPRRRRKRLPALADLPWRRIATAAVVVAIVVAIFYRSVDMEKVQDEAARLPGAIAFILLVLLPLIGFPASVLHVAAGIRFGGPLGYGLVVASIVLQLIASYWIVRIWRRYFEKARWLQRVRERIPKGAHSSVCAFTVLLPGVPYAVVNYTLPLLGVPLRTLLLCALPLHALRATVTVAFGDQSSHLTGTRLVVLAAYALLILGVSAWLYHRLQSRFAGRPRAAGGRKQPA
jgi:uncharacterized membrane protein YdjX (TVP38/TMEM64 family)